MRFRITDFQIQINESEINLKSEFGTLKSQDYL